MAYRYGNREQAELFPQSIEEYVADNDPVRAYDAFVESLDFNELGIETDENKVGNSEYNPKSMLKLLLYGYSYGFRSSRKLERALYHNISFIWLMGGLKPDHKTIANFRKNNKKPLKNVLMQCARLCIEFGLIEGNTLFFDSTKIRANASIKNAWTKEKCEKYLKHIDKHIEDILSECDAADDQEQHQSSLVKLKEELANKEALQSAVKKLMNKLKDSKVKSINTTDPESTRINSLQGTNAGYNAQIAVDNKHGLIINSGIVSENNDVNQFANQVNQANQVLGKKCETACADSGYANTQELKQVDEQGIKVIVPSQRQASEKDPKPFDKERFQYDCKNDHYVCPEGNLLKYVHTDNKEKAKVYMPSDSHICKQCRRFGDCTKSKKGRQINRLIDEEIRQRLEAQYNEAESQAIYKLRMQKAELPFGHIKRNLGVSAFLLRGIEGAKAEIALLTSNFNISRMITILGVPVLINKLKGKEQEEMPFLAQRIAG